VTATLPDRQLRPLVVAHLFPPCGGAGVQRTAKLVAYLASHDWQPTVLTVRPTDYGLTDASLLSPALASSLDVVRTPCFDPVTRFTRPASHDAGPPDATERGRRGVGRPLRALAKAGWRLAERHLLIPDRTVVWLPEAVAAARRIHRDRPFDLVYATADPYSSFLIARRIARTLSVPYVLDMRDPWTHLSYMEARHTPVRQSIERWLERRVLRDCAACIFANGAIETYRTAYPHLAGKFSYVPNGYDPDDFAGVAPRPFDRFTIVHNGTFLSGYRTADTFLRAVRLLLDKDPEIANRLQVFFVGKVGSEREVSERLGLQGLVTHAGYVPHRDSLSYVLGADALLLVGGAHAWEETGKVYEYLATGRPILALVEPGGAAARLLNRAQGSRIVPRDSVPESAAAIRALLDAGRGARTPVPDWLPAYRRDALAARIADVLTAAVSDRNPARLTRAADVRRTSRVTL